MPQNIFVLTLKSEEFKVIIMFLQKFEDIFSLFSSF